MTLIVTLSFIFSTAYIYFMLPGPPIAVPIDRARSVLRHSRLARNSFNDHDFGVLKQLGATIYNAGAPPLEGRRISRPANGLCGYHCLADSNLVRDAQDKQKTIATWLRDHPSQIIGDLSILGHIQHDYPGKSSTDYYNHHMGIASFSRSAANRIHEWIGHLEIVTDCFIDSSSVMVCIDFSIRSGHNGTYFQPIWSFGEIGPTTRYLTYDGSHFNSITGPEPFISHTGRRTPSRPPLAPAGPAQRAPLLDGGAHQEADGHNGGDRDSDSDSDSDSDRGEAAERGATGTIVLVGEPQRLEPQTLVGRQFCFFDDGEDYWELGTIASFKLPEEGDSDAIKALGASFLATFDNKDEKCFYATDFLPFLIPPGENFDSLSRADWNMAKLIYKTLSERVADGTANVNSPPFLRDLFRFRSIGNVTADKIKQKFKELSRKLHPDRIDRAGIPLKVKYVCFQVLSGCRYFKELYLHFKRATPRPSIDPPCALNLPAYGTAAFEERSASGPEPLTQDPFVHQPSPTSPGNTGGARASPAVPPNDPDGLDLPVEHSAFDDANFNPDLIPNSFEALDSFDLKDTFLNSFTSMKRVPYAVMEDWARAYSLAAQMLIDACKVSSLDPSYRANITRAAKWYSCLPQLIFRQPGKGTRDQKIVQTRLHEFLTGNCKSLVSHWYKDVLKQRGVRGSLPVQTSEKKLKDAVDKILSGEVGRGLERLESHGCAPRDNAAIRDQMKEKHPAPRSPVNWPELPEGWLASIDIDLSPTLKLACHNADPDTGVGPRKVNVHHIQVLAEGVFVHPDASKAFGLFSELGSKYLFLGMPAWLRYCLGGGLLTALNKKAPELNATPDARPVKAEDSDTSLWCKALASISKGPVLDQVKPQQFGVGVSGGVELYIKGLKFKFETAVTNGVELVFDKADLKNAHNSFPRDLTQARLIEVARSNPKLIPLAVASESILRAGNPIYMRSGKTSTGFSFLCDSLMGGGQGNALTGLFFVINLDPVLKCVEGQCPGVEIKAIQDDITLMGPPEVVWDRTDELGVVHKGALSVLLDGLKARGLEPNPDKFACLGTTPGACLGKPDWLTEPTSFMDTNGNVTEARGIDICNNPIGEKTFVQAYLTDKLDSICCAIIKASAALNTSNLHADFLSFYYSYQSRWDYWCATNNLEFIDPLSSKLDSCLHFVLEKATGLKLFDPPTTGGPLPWLTFERSELSTKHGGLGFRPYKKRLLLLNSLTNSLSQAIDRADEDGVVTPGLWNSLSSVLGAGSFDHANKDTCWATFHDSGLSFANDHKTLINRAKDRYSDSLNVLGEVLPDSGLLVTPAVGFGYGTSKLHSAIQHVLGDLEYQGLLSFVKSDLPSDDQRSLSFLRTHDNKFANAFPLAFPQDTYSRFGNTEFTIAIARKFGLPIPILGSYVGTRVRASGRSLPTVVDPYGNGVASAPGVPGDFFRKNHDRLLRPAMQAVADSGIPATGKNQHDTCNGTFKHCFNPGVRQVNDETSINIQKIIPDGIIDARGMGTLGPYDNPPNRLNGFETLVEMKTVASLGESNEAREKRFLNDTLRRVQHLDVEFPGSSFEQTLMSFGQNGKYLVLVNGPFANLSEGFKVLVDLLARVRAFRQINRWQMNPKWALALNRHALTQRFGSLAALLWAQHISGRFRCAVSKDTNRLTGTDTDFERLFSNRCRGGFRGGFVPSA